MDNESYIKLKEFINCSLNEIDFYNFSHEELISFREYLFNMRCDKILFEEEIEPMVYNIKRKNVWVKSIGSSGPCNLNIYSSGADTFSNLKVNSNGVFSIFKSKNITNEMVYKLITSSYFELEEIEKIAKKHFKDSFRVYSTSGNFSLRNRFFYSTLECFNEPMFDIGRDNFLVSSYTYDSFSNLFSNDYEDNVFLKDKMLDRIYVKK